MQEKRKNDTTKDGKSVEKYNYTKIDEDKLEYSELQKKNSLGEISDIEEYQQQQEEEQREILDLREVIKQAAKDNAEELTKTLENMLTEAKTKIDENNKTTNKESVGELKKEFTDILDQISKPIKEVNEFLINEEKDKELDKLREIMSDNLVKIEEYMKVQSERIQYLEDKTSSLIKNIVEKVIGMEISERSDKVIMSNLRILFNEYREAKEVKIFLNKKDYAIVRNQVETLFMQKEMELENLKFIEDETVKTGSFLLLTDKGNFDSSIEAKIKLIIDSIL